MTKTSKKIAKENGFTLEKENNGYVLFSNEKVPGVEAVFRNLKRSIL